MSDSTEKRKSKSSANKSQTSHKTFLDGEYIFREGETGGHAYVLNSGHVEIFKASASGQFKVAEVEQGALFGEMALIDSAPRSASARAAGDVSLTEVNKQGFLGYISKNPDMAMSLMTRLSGYVRDLNESVSRLERTSDESTATDSAAGRAERTVSPNDDKSIALSIPDTEAIYEQPASRLLFRMLYSILAFLFFFVLFSVFLSIDTTVSTRGKITTTVPNVIIQAPANARVNALLVQRGDFVKKGYVIARLDDTIVSANLKIVQDKLSAAAARKLRLEYERMALGDESINTKTADLDSISEDILLKRVEEYQSRLTLFSAQLDQNSNQTNALRNDLRMLREQLGLKEEIEEAWKGLFESKAGSQIQYLAAKEARLNASLTYTDAGNRMKQLQSGRESLLAERDAFIAERFSALAENYVSAMEDFSQLTEEERKLLQQLDDLDVLAPVSGNVLDMPKLGAGSIVAQGQEIVTLVRSDAPLTLEIDIDPKDRSDLHIGQSASVKFDALPFQQYGDISGVLAFVSSDTFPDALDGTPGPFYRGRVDLLQADLNNMPNGVQVSPGMLASSDLLVGDRKLITYFINPILRNVRGAFKEPD